MKDKLIVEERMKQFNKDVLRWKNYDYVVINDNLKNCYKEVNSLIESEVNKTKINYNTQLVEKHVNQLVI
jgi:guanylate kinase